MIYLKQLQLVALLQIDQSRMRLQMYNVDNPKAYIERARKRSLTTRLSFAAALQYEVERAAQGLPPSKD